MFERYEKVERLEKSECDGLLNGKVWIFEKLDGANASIWLDNGVLCCGSRNNQLLGANGVTNSFRGFVPYVQNHEGIARFLHIHEPLKLCGEWLIKHTINYPTEFLNKFYTFDVKNMRSGEYLTYEEYAPILDYFGIDYIKPFDVLENPTMEQVKAYVGKTNYDAQGGGEGIVAKNYEFVNKWGQSHWGKVVRDEFKEVANMVFGNVPKANPVEERIVGKYITEPRVRKHMDKLRQEKGTLALEMSDIPRIMGMLYHDLIDEDMWDILKNFKHVTIDFGVLQRQCNNVTKNYFIGILQNGVTAFGE